MKSIDPILFYKCLTDEIRLKCLMLLESQGELCVCELMQALDAIQPKISRNLAMLRKHQLLTDRRQGQWIFYQINPELPSWAKSVISTTSVENTRFVKLRRK